MTNSTFENNSHSGIHLLDNIDTYLQNITVQYNGFSGNSDEEKAGIHFDRSKTVSHPQLDVICSSCDVMNSAGSGILIHDSADLWLNDIYLADNGANFTPLHADNSGLNLGQQGGVININGIEIHTERGTGTSIPAVEINQAAASIDSLLMHGNHSGIEWNGQNHNNYPSVMSNTTFSGTQCLQLSNHLDLSGIGNTISAECTGTIQLVNSQVNWSGFTDLGLTPTILQLDSNSDLHLHQPANFDFTQSSPTIASGATIDVAYDINVWVINNNSNGIPGANVGASFLSLIHI